MTDNFDYRKPRIQIEELFPDIFKTDINVSVLNNAENRLLTKPDTVYVDNAIGLKKPNIPNTNRITETDAHRQAWQLQPLLYSKIATIDHITSYYDILNKLEQLGVNIDHLPSWGNALQFNYAPPVNIDKLVNYNNYYWYDTTGKTTPQYITIENQFNTVNSKLLELQRYLSDRTIANALSSELQAIKNTINQYFVLQQQLRNKHVGFDVALWDDNSGDWDPLSIWETVGYDDTHHVIPVEAPQGTNEWDTDNVHVISEWAFENKWVHESDLPHTAIGIQATMPILEYHANLELNEWTYTKQNWLYRKDTFDSWDSVDTEPTLNECSVRYNIVNISKDTTYVGTPTGDVVFVVSGDVTALFITGYMFTVANTIDNNGAKTTQHSELSANGLYTIIYVNDAVIIEAPGMNNTVPYSSNEYLGYNVNIGVIVPLTTTSLGDTWKGFYFHWRWGGASDAVPVNHQIPNLKQQRYVVIMSINGFDVDAYDEGLDTEWNRSGLSLTNNILINPTTIDPITYVTTVNGVSTYFNGEVLYTSYNDVPKNAIGTSNPFNYLYGLDDLQVYINGIRQYGNYEEIQTNTEYSNTVLILSTLKTGDIIQLRSGVPCSLDIGRELIWVNTPTGMVRTSLVRFKKHEQVKLQHTQYPLFDIYNVDKTTAYQANSIFQYEEKSTNAVDSRVNKRISVLNKGRNYIFQQLLSNSTTGEMYCYKDYDNTSIDNIDGLHTIWQKGANNEEYVPKYVNEYRLADGETYLDAVGNSHTTSLPLGDPAGAWEIPDQLYYNAQHENRTNISYTDLYKHFNTIIESQNIPVFDINNNPVSFDFIPQQNQYKLLDRVNFGLGGTIKEHNGCYDMFLSAMYQNIITPPTLIKYAQQQYENNILMIKEMFLSTIPEIIANISIEAIIDLQQTVTDTILLKLQNNDNLTHVFSDTTAYDSITKAGVANWIATLPILQFAQKHEPQLLIDDKLQLFHILHHDGHFSDNRFTDVEIGQIIKRVLNSSGTSGTGNKPSIHGLNNGTFWYNTSTKQLWKYNVIAIQHAYPANTTPYGVYWYDDTTNTLYVRSHAIIGWDVVVDQSLAWQLVDINQVISKTILAIETKLYNKCENVDILKIDYDNLYNITTASTYVNLLYKEYINYTKVHNINIFYTDYNIADSWTWNYTTLPEIADVTINRPNVGTGWGSRWYTIYKELYNTSYPHLEPWKMQGYLEKPINWDTLYADTSNGGRWKAIMWDNIQSGNIINVNPQLTTIIPTYNDHISVNISGTTIDTYAPDDLLPPYVSNVNLQPYTIVSYTTLTPGIQAAISASYEFGQQGPAERLWRDSSSFRYSILSAAFIIQPVKFIQQAFGLEFYEINKLQIEKQTKKVISHKDTSFHGMVIGNTTQSINGINQWYVNAIRSKGYDIYISDFTTMWRDWDVKLTYQTNSIVNAKSLILGTDYYQISNQDYTTHLKKSPGVYDNWLNSIMVSLYQAGISQRTTTGVLIPIGNGDDWQFRLDVPVNPNTNINVYDVNNYSIVNVNDITNVITINKSSPWTDGTQIALTSNIKGIKNSAPYYLISETPTTFKLASAYVDGIARNNDITVYDTINHTITLNDTVPPVAPMDLDIWSYNDGIGNPVFKQYHKLTKSWQIYSSSSHVFRLPTNTDAINLRMYYNNTLLIEHTDYVIYANGWVQIINGLNFDPAHPSLTIRLLLSTGVQVYEQYTTFDALDKVNCTNTWMHYTINPTRIIPVITPTIITGIQSIINFIDGYSAYLQSQGFVFNDYSRTSVDIESGLLVSWQTELEKFIDKVWRGFNTKFDIHTQQLISVYDVHELNPFRYDVWISPKQGIISNIISGPYADITAQPIVYDQYGDPILSIDNLKIFREDTTTYITYPKPADIPFEEKELHLGGMHLFSDLYEHIITFNNYTIDGNLIYDPYIGLNVSKIHTLFNKHYEITGRPNLGGYFLIDGTMIENIESATTNLQNYYDVYKSDETADHIEYARQLLGYKEPAYLDLLGINKKSKFIFWRGMIQHKGANTAISALTNSRLLTDANIDEYWAYKVSEFGDSRTKIKPAINVFLSDMVRGAARYQFMNTYDVTTPELYFTKITNTDVDRWDNLPDADYLIHNALYFDAEISSALTFNHLDIINPLNTRIKTSAFNAINDSHQYVEVDVCDGVQIFVDNNTTQVADIANATSTIIIPTPEITDDVVVSIKSPCTIIDSAFNETNTIIVLQQTYTNLEVYVTNAANITISVTFTVSGPTITIPTKYTSADTITVYTNNILSTITNNTLSTSIVLSTPYVLDYGVITVKINNIITSFTINTIITLPYVYILGVNNLILYVDGNVYNNYQEVNSSTILLNSIPHTSVTVIKQRAILKEHTDTQNGQYKQLSTTLIEMLIDITNENTVPVLTIFLLNPAKSKISDCKLIDAKSNVVTKELPIWDPIRGHYPTNVNLMVDYFTTSDPAQYKSIIATTPNDISYSAWNSTEVGKVWMNISMLGYVPYTDFRLYPTINDRLFAWGDVPEWSSIEVYEWVESPVIPLMWDQLVLADVNNTIISEKDKHTGEVYSQLFYTTRLTTDDVWNEWLPVIDTHLIFKGYDYEIINNAITIDVTSQNINTISDKFSVFINEQITTNFIIVQDSNNVITHITSTGVTSSSILRVVKYAKVPLSAEIAQLAEDDTALLRYNEVLPYTSTFKLDESGNSRVFTYYFWVKNRTNRNKHNLSVLDVKHMFNIPQIPYVFYQHLLYDNSTLPNRYDQCIVNNISYDINEGNRYKLQFTRDCTLRDQLDNSNAMLKNKHNEWKVFRENDISIIPRFMWDKITETILGNKLQDVNYLIPSLSRVLFDKTNNTTTKYGFGTDQAIGPKNIIFDSLINQLEDSNSDLQTINKENFLENYNFNTALNIDISMTYIYQSFPSSVINKIFFNILNDALTYNHELTGLFKTSMVALDCTLTFETASSVIDV